MKKFGTKVLDKNETHFMTSIIFLQVLMLFDIIKQYTADVPECYTLRSMALQPEIKPWAPMRIL
jgi:hypothetical protein